MEIISPSGRSNGILPVEDQVFSNHIIVSSIWKHFDTQDLLRTSLVSASWCAQSRKCLQNNENNLPVCIEISHESPCRQLKKFNEFLGETDCSNDQIIFNGIQCRPLSGEGSFANCDNCLTNEWKAAAHRTNLPLMTHRMLEQIIVKNMLITYRHVLEKLKFKFIRIQYDYPFSCPIAKFVKWVLKKQPKDILELDLKNLVLTNQPGPYRNVSYFGDKNHSTAVPMKFPNLKVLGLPDSMYKGNWVNDNGVSAAALPIVAPLLKTIRHFEFHLSQVSDDDTSETFPYHAITNTLTWIGPDSIEDTLDFITEFHPKIENITLGEGAFDGIWNGDEEEEDLAYPIRFDIFRLSHLISTSLTSLTCSFQCFTLVSSKYSRNGEIITNSFPRLQCLELSGRLDVLFMDWSNGRNLYRECPKLTEVKIIFDDPTDSRTSSAFNGPINRIANIEWRTAVNLIVCPNTELQTKELQPGFLPTLLRVFAHVRHLDLRQLRFTCNARDEAFGEVMSELENLLFLEEITVEMGKTAMGALCLDHLFLENISAVRENMAGMHLDDLLLYKASVLNHKTLKQINITGPPICIETVCHITDERICESSQRPGIFLVTSRTAELIRKYRPGFQFHVKVDDGDRDHMSECKSEHRPGGFRLEHLETLAKISSKVTANKIVSITVEF